MIVARRECIIHARPRVRGLSARGFVCGFFRTQILRDDIWRAKKNKRVITRAPNSIVELGRGGLDAVRKLVDGVHAVHILSHGARAIRLFTPYRGQPELNDHGAFISTDNGQTQHLATTRRDSGNRDIRRTCTQFINPPDFIAANMLLSIVTTFCFVRTVSHSENSGRPFHRVPTVRFFFMFPKFVFQSLQKRSKR